MNIWKIHLNHIISRLIIIDDKTLLCNITVFLRLEFDVTRAGNEPSFEHFELGLLIYERARARAELLNEFKIRFKLCLIKKKKNLASAH